MRNLALASLHLLLTGRYGSSRRAPGISFRRRVPDTLVVWMLAHRLCVGTAPHYSIRSLILCGTIRASGLGRERRGGRPRTFWVLSGVGGVSSLFDDLFTMAAGHSLDADRVTHASERYGRLLFVVCCFDTAVRTAMKRRIPKCLLENSIASCVLFCQYAGLGRNRLEILSLLAENARRSFSAIGEEVGLSGPAVSDRVTRLQETESSTTSLSMSTVADSELVCRYSSS